jgi:hypothetical protein
MTPPLDAIFSVGTTHQPTPKTSTDRDGERQAQHAQVPSPFVLNNQQAMAHADF